MNVLLLSDSHGHPDYIRAAVCVARPDCILFAGDGLRDLREVEAELTVPVYAVRGNCDFGWSADGYATEEIVTLAGVRILLVHGHTLGVKSGLGRATIRTRELGVDVLVFGHTHEVCERYMYPDEMADPDRGRRPLLLCNPGSVGTYPHHFGTLMLRDGQALFGSGEL